MGLNRMHFDITVPQMTGYKFKHFHFGMGAPREETNNTLAESVQKLVQQHGKCNEPQFCPEPAIMQFGGCSAVQE
jgi:hypothetical protein